MKSDIHGERTVRSGKAAQLAGGLLLLAGVAGAELRAEEIHTVQDFGHGQLIAAGSRALMRFEVESREVATLTLPPSARGVSAMAAYRPGNIYVASPGSGVWASRDGGNTWAVGNEGLPGGGQVKFLAIHAREQDTVYAYVSGNGIYRSEDGGESWLLMDAGPEGMTGPLIHSDMPGSMQTGWLFAATTNGVSRSMDCFCLWQRAGTLEGEIFGLTFDPRQPAHLYATTGKGVFRSRNGGEDWERVSVPDPRIRAVVFTASGVLYGVSEGSDLYGSVDEAESWQRVDGF